MRIEPYSGVFGAMVHDVDLCQPLSASGLADIRGALLEYEVLFFRDQPLKPEHHAALALHFGPPQHHEAYDHVEGFPQITILENDEARPSKIEVWHTDMTFRQAPPMGSILHAVIVPPKGGDTMFSSMSAAFDGLSDKMQILLSGLTAVHDFSYGFKESIAEPGGRERLADMVRDNPPVEHPVVRIHPESGKQSLYVNPLFTVAIKGMKDKESRALLDFLYLHMTTPECTCRFRWQRDSIAFWDNRITQHKPVNDYWPQHRKMQRITIEGDQPSA
ncbi:MAG: taurine dioxygenase [Candidatus Azotimanducaceae bacterium]|jgi:taurine dioxygenase